MVVLAHERVESFRWQYHESLCTAMAEHPDKFADTAQDSELVTERVLLALQRGTMHFGGPAMRACCKALGIPCTSKGVAKYLAGET